MLLADDEDFQDQLRKLDGAAAKLQGMLIKMDKGECSPLDAEPPLKNFKRKLQSFAVEVTDLDADILKTSYPSKSLGGKHNPKSLHKKFKELERSSADRIERATPLRMARLDGPSSSSPTQGPDCNYRPRCLGR